MDPMLLFYLMVMIVFLSIPISCYATRYFKRRRQILMRLECNWLDAKMERLSWRINCDDTLFYFDDPVYQELWLIEIGAEDCYLHRVNWPRKNTSWQEYLEEREFCQKQTFG